MDMINTNLKAKLKLIAENTTFNYIVLAVIIFSAILIGVGTDEIIKNQYRDLMTLLENLILAFFCIELLIRILAENKPFDYFKDPWNLFDFIIVVLCFIPFKDKAIYVLRLVRVLRTFRLFRAFPNLRPVVNGLVSSISSVIFVAMLLGVVVYIYAVIGVSMFAIADPIHFGTLWRGLFTLFQVLTLENWNTIMLPTNSMYPVGGPLYFISFIILGTMIIMNLFLGIIVGNMSKAMEKLNETDSMKSYLNEDAEREKEITVRLRKIEHQLHLIARKKRRDKKK
jgi:voltage-gated sodium channel